MAARRGKSQARRNTGSGGGSLPGWAWMVLGVVLTVGVILAAPKLLKDDGGDGFFRPKANPDAQPVASGDAEDAEGVVAGDEPGPNRPASDAVGDEPDYDFYDLLPGEEVAMTDAQLAAAAREEAERARREQQRLAQQQAAQGDAAGNTERPQPLPEAATPAAAAGASTPASAAPAAGAPATANDTPYVLQAGAFGASGDAEAVKAKIALLGLNARVESAQIGGKTVYRVRMGPYGTASELATAKGKLATGGLPALAIKAK